MQQDFLSLNDSDTVCLSGGAEGADLAWGNAASERGDEVIHFIFAGHRSRALPSQKVVLNAAQLTVADPFLEHANKALRRRWPVQNNFVANLFRRNYYQVAWSQSCYAISEIGNDQLVKGGTSWAVQMMIDLHPESKIYVFDQRKEQWFQWKNGWCPIIAPPPPSGVWTGIGTRELNPAGEHAIRSLLGASG